MSLADKESMVIWSSDRVVTDGDEIAFAIRTKDVREAVRTFRSKLDKKEICYPNTQRPILLKSDIIKYMEEVFGFEEQEAQTK